MRKGKVIWLLVVGAVVAAVAAALIGGITLAAASQGAGDSPAVVKGATKEKGGPNTFWD